MRTYLNALRLFCFVLFSPLIFLFISLLGTLSPQEKKFSLFQGLWKICRRNELFLFSLFIHLLSFCQNKHICILKSRASVHSACHRLTFWWILWETEKSKLFIGLHPTWKCLRIYVAGVNECWLVSFGLMALCSFYQWLNTS